MSVREWCCGLGCVLLLAGCDATRCGAGTVLVEGVCVLASSDAGAPGDGGAADGASGDAAAMDAHVEPDRCVGSDLSICEGSTVVSCTGASPQTCSGRDACLTLRRADGARESFCGPAGATPCDSATYMSTCVGAVLQSCLHRSSAAGIEPGWVLTNDCADEGPAGACVSAPSAHCESTACDPATFEPRCEGTRGVSCESDRLRYSDCGGAYRCAIDRIRGGLACVGTGAVESARATANPEVIGCISATEALIQRNGWQWRGVCEPAVIRVDGEFVTAPTFCVEREGDFSCAPEASYRPRCDTPGWSCAGSDRSRYCEAGRAETFRCEAGCDPATSRCVAPLRCDPGAAPTGRCLELGVAASCADDNGDGVGWISRISCPVCTAEPFSCD